MSENKETKEFEESDNKPKMTYEKAMDNAAKIMAFYILPRFYIFLEKYDKEIKAVKSGKITIEDFKKRLKHDNVHDNLSKIIILIKDNPKVTLAEMASAIGRCKKTVQRLIASSDKVVRLGGARNGYWKVKDSL